MAKFTLTIRLGNAAMSTPDDIAQALHKVASEQRGMDATDHDWGGIKDENGNTVGEWSRDAVQDEDAEDDDNEDEEDEE